MKNWWFALILVTISMVSFFYTLRIDITPTQVEANQEKATPFKWQYRINPNIGSGEITAMCLNGYLYYLTPNGNLVQALQRSDLHMIPIGCTE